MILTIIIIAYIILGYVAYKKYISKWDKPLWEKIWLSAFWICVLPLYGIRKIQDGLS